MELKKILSFILAANITASVISPAFAADGESFTDDLLSTNPNIQMTVQSQSYVYVNGVKLTNGAFWKNGDTINPTGTASNYNAHFEDGTLYLNDAKITQKDDQEGGISSQGDLHIILSGNSNFAASSAPSYGIQVEGSLTISGDGTISNYMQIENANIGTFGGNVGIWALNDITVLSGTITEKVGGMGIMCGGTYRQYGGNVTVSGTGAAGLFTETSIQIEGGKLHASSEYETFGTYGNISVSGNSLVISEGKRSAVFAPCNTQGMTIIAGQNESTAKPVRAINDDYKYVAIYSPTYSPNRFLDVNSTDWFYDSVGYAYNSSIASGTSAVRFSPDLSCTRGQIMQMLWKANGSPEPTISKNPFTDIKASDYFYKAILWAVEKGITSGVSQTAFAPSDICTRAQAMTFLWNATGKQRTSNMIPFADVHSDDYFYDPVKWAVSKGVTSGTSASAFSPDQRCTRAQIVTFIYKAMH